MLLADIGQDLLIAQVFVIEIGNFAVEAVDVIESKFTGSQGLTPLRRGSPADSTNAGKVDVEIIGSTWILIANLQGRRAGSVTWIAVYAQLDIIDVLITRDHGFRIQRVARARKKKVGHHIRAPLGAVLFDRIPQNFPPFHRPPGFVVVPQPTIEKIPGQFLADLRIVRIELWKRLSGDIIQQLAVGAEANLAGIFFGGFDVFLERVVDLGRFDLHGVAGFDATQKILADHALNPLPVLRTDGLSCLEIRFGCRRLGSGSKNETAEKHDRKASS